MVLLCLWLAPAGGRAADEIVPGIVPLENRERVQQLNATNAALHQGKADMLVLPGLVADRKRQRVEALAESTGLAEKGILEFLLISDTSWHGYEALAVSFARPSDIHKALEFIGLRAGAPYYPPKFRMWPKGERVILSLVPFGSTSTPVRIEDYILDTRTGKTMPPAGFVFTGSIMVPAAEGRPGQEYGADVCEPKAIVSIYNESSAALDVPRIAHQSDVYGDQVVKPGLALAKGTLLTAVLEPEYKDGRKRVKDLVLEAGAAAAAPKKAAEPNPAATNAVTIELTWRLQDPAGRIAVKEPGLPGVKQALESLVAQGCDPFVSVKFGREMSLAAAQQAGRVIADLDDGKIMRVEPPAPGQLYYRTFLADEQWRQRENRPSQPWELVLSPKDGQLAGKLILVEAPGWDAGPDAKFKAEEFEVADARALRRQFDADAARRKAEKKMPHVPVLLVFADPALTYGRLVDFIEPALSANYVVYVLFSN